MDKDVWTITEFTQERVRVLDGDIESMAVKAKQCKTADELMALAKSGGVELTKEEAEAYLKELLNLE